MHFKTSVLLLASLFAHASASTIQDILNDLATLQSSLVTLDGAITSFPDSGGTVDQAVAIHTDTTAVKDAIDAATPDAVNVERPVSVDDANSVLAAIQGLQPDLESALSGVVAKKPAFDTLGVSATVAQDLNDLNTSNMALENALLDATPPEVLASAEETSTEFNDAIASAIAAYS